MKPKDSKYSSDPLPGVGWCLIVVLAIIIGTGCFFIIALVELGGVIGGI